MADATDRIDDGVPVRRLPFERADAAPGRSLAEQAVFTATEQLLRSTSIGELSVAQVLKQADVSRTTFYRYFTSKHAVVSAMLEALQSELVDVMRPWTRRGDREPQAALTDALRAVAGVWADHRPILRASTENWHAEPEVGKPWVAMMDRFTADVAGQVRRERDAGAAPAGVDATDLARTLVWSSERMLYLAGFGMTGDGDEQGVVEALVAMWLGTIYGGGRSTAT